MPAIVITHPEHLCITCYFRPEKYSSDEVRRYYDNMILHMVEGLNIEGYQAHNFEGLLKLQSTHPLTHVFIAQAEYEENSAYYEELASTLQVVVIAEQKFVPDINSRLLVIHKPFFALSVVNLLNGEIKEHGFGEAQAAGRKPFSCEGIHVLAVDDEEMNLVVAKGVLGSYGIQVDTCLSGKEALERCATTSYDIIFLDHMMPGFDGVETLKQIREMKNGIYQELPVIALTANTISSAREMFRNEGFTEFIPKPIERSVLERVLRKVLPENSVQYSTAPPSADVFSDTADALEKLSPEETEQKESVLEEAVPEDIPVSEKTLVPEEDDILSSETTLSFAPLSKIGINIQLGLDYCCGEADFYLEMLQMFCPQAADKKAEIIFLYETENWKDYAVKVHALKSTSLTIGAEQLADQAKLLEQAGKARNIKYIRHSHPILLRLYDEVCETIAGL